MARERVHGRICYLATVRQDGSPRVFPVGGCIGQGTIWLFVGKDSPKRYDLRNDGRFALHCEVEDTHGGLGEIHVTGVALEVTDAIVREEAIEAWPGEPVRTDWLLFSLDPLAVSHTTYAGSSPIRSSWRSGTGHGP